MSWGVDAYVSFPISGSTEAPYLHIRVVEQCHSATLYVIPAQNTPLIILPANPNRRGIGFVNLANGEALIGFGLPPSLNAFSAIIPSVDKKTTMISDFSAPRPVYTGDIWAVWDDTGVSLSGSAMLTEFTDA